MADGAVIATVAAPQAALFGNLPPVSPGQTDIALTGNLDNARYELHRALDRGNDADVLAWARRWGEAIVAGVDGFADEADRLQVQLDESHSDWGPTNEAAVQEVESHIESAGDAATAAEAALSNPEARDVDAAIEHIKEIIKHLGRASKELDTL